MSRHLAVAAVVAVALAASSQAVGRARPSAPEPVVVYATVVDAAGRLLPNLAAEDFELYANGKKQDIASFSPTVPAVSLVVLIDTSASMALVLDPVRSAIERLLNALPPQDRVRAGTFSSRIDLSPEFTTVRRDISGYLRQGLYSGGGTRLWDALLAGTDALAVESNRRAVLVMTDGDDTTSRSSLDEASRQAQRANCVIDVLALVSRTVSDRGAPPRVDLLKKVAADTGGGYLLVPMSADFRAVMDSVAAGLHAQYVLGFTPQTLDGKAHDLKVVVKRDGAKVRVRRTYTAPRAG